MNFFCLRLLRFGLVWRMILFSRYRKVRLMVNTMKDFEIIPVVAHHGALYTDDMLERELNNAVGALVDLLIGPGDVGITCGVRFADLKLSMHDTIKSNLRGILNQAYKVEDLDAVLSMLKTASVDREAR